jgi:hypothetical protein
MQIANQNTLVKYGYCHVDWRTDASGLPTAVTDEMNHEFNLCLLALLQQFGIILLLCLIVMWYALHYTPRTIHY